MDDSDCVCPLCCEELDISDREFYPCKCGYQVCMWCWHRIRESESGLCPACRTPYGEDPHQFSAVDVEDVLKANKEKEVAAKKERDKQRQVIGEQQGEEDAALPIPSDRTQLSIMRVIRRNLVYAVGLPIQIATEEILKRPEYFGQYGKIHKIVINRAQTQGTDPRRATASAYVTFVHKEDTLACILGLDGFFLENRNIRASYGTSKYCSAFIKNVRCNNPECTYLHEMGAGEDTFTKQEIQAGYVTSGRDVLARQQQIVAEQLRLGAVTGIPRKRIGGGGPSGTGKASNNPVFPPPEFDEAIKPSSLAIPPPAGSIPRSMTTGGINTINPSTVPAKLGRAASISSPSTGAEKSPNIGSLAPPMYLAGVPKRVQALPLSTTMPTTTAASVVAGAGRQVKTDMADPHTTLTPLTPLKRNSKPTRSVSGAPPQPAANDMKSGTLRNGAIKRLNEALSYSGSIDSDAHDNADNIIGGQLIGPPMLRHTQGFDSPDELSSSLTPVVSSGSQEFSLGETEYGHASALGGELFTGTLPNSSAIGNNNDRWNTNANATVNASTFGGPGSGDLWSNSVPFSSSLDEGHAAIGGSVIGGLTIPSAGTGNNSSSTLASLLGISLPTGSGSLASFGDLWATNEPTSLSALNDNATPVNNLNGAYRTSIGGSSLIGGVPIAGSSIGSAGTIGGGNKNDIALLQSLLPGVHITAGGDDYFGVNPGWSNGGAGDAGQRPNPVGPSGLNGRSTAGASGKPQQDQRRGQGIW